MLGYFGISIIHQTPTWIYIYIYIFNMCVLYFCMHIHMGDLSLSSHLKDFCRVHRIWLWRSSPITYLQQTMLKVVERDKHAFSCMYVCVCVWERERERERIQLYDFLVYFDVVLLCAVWSLFRKAYPEYITTSRRTFHNRTFNPQRYAVTCYQQL